MIHEMRILRIKPGTMGEALDLLKTYRDVLHPKYGTREGMWVSDAGDLNRVWRLTSYESQEDLREKRAKLLENSTWTDEYVPKLAKFIQNHETHILEPVILLSRPVSGNIFEYRTYRTESGAAGRVASLMHKAAALRSGYVHDVCMWVADKSPSDEFSHMVAHRDMAARTKERAAMMADPEWVEAHREMTRLLVSARSEILNPVEWSELK